jgi:hypothetical protein
LTFRREVGNARVMRKNATAYSSIDQGPGTPVSETPAAQNRKTTPRSLHTTARPSGYNLDPSLDTTGEYGSNSPVVADCTLEDLTFNPWRLHEVDEQANESDVEGI